MDATSKKLVQLLDSGELDLRMSAIRIICEVGVNSREVIHSLAKCLREEPEPLRILALRALARLGAREVADMVVPMILESGALRDYALQVVTAVGSSVVPQLRSLYGGADFHGKRAVATALSQIGGRPAFDFLLGVLPDEPFELQKHVTRCICEALDSLPPAAQAPLYQPVLRFLSSKRAQKDSQILVAGLIIVGYFHGEKLARSARAHLLRYTDSKKPPEVRRHALVSFQRLLGEGVPGQDQVATLEKLLCDEDWHNVAQHALLAFQKVALPRGKVLKLVSLLHKSPHFSVHIHVFERLRGHDSREVVRAIIPFLSDSRFRVRDAAEVALRSLPSAIEDLFGVLMDSEDSEVCQRVTAILREYPQEVKRRFVEAATKKFIALFDQNDGRYQFFFDFVQAIDAEPLRERIYQKARALKTGRSKDKWIKIGGYLQILWDHHLITPSGRYLFAVALIRQSNKDLSPPARRANLGLRVIRALIYDDTPGLLSSLQKDRDIGPEDLFYIGFHFMEEGEEMRPFAKALLEHLMRKYPRSKVASPARQKLELHLAQKPAEASLKVSRAASKTAAAQAKLVAPAQGEGPPAPPAREGAGGRPAAPSPAVVSPRAPSPRAPSPGKGRVAPAAASPPQKALHPPAPRPVAKTPAKHGAPKKSGSKSGAAKSSGSKNSARRAAPSKRPPARPAARKAAPRKKARAKR
jgi:hypothetical protein